jgi:hypothetical protein
MSTSQRTKATKCARNCVTISYDDDPTSEEAYCDITVMQSATGCIFRSTTFVGALEVASDKSADPWSKGFFDKNSEAFVADSLPDELPNLDTLDLQLDFDEEIKNCFKVRESFTIYSLFTDKSYQMRLSRF